MTYTLLRGSFVIRYPDLPSQGPEPDGDTVKFQPERPELVNSLPRDSGHPARINAHGVSVRLEAIDALETHFAGTHQELLGANRAREALLAELGFTGVSFFPDAPNRVERADQDSVVGHLVSNGIDANGRVIGFAYAGEGTPSDGAEVALGEEEVDRSANAMLLRPGLVYPAFYSTLPEPLRLHLAGVSRDARTAATENGIWPRSTGDPDGPAEVADFAQLQELVIWPKLFRRLVTYLSDDTGVSPAPVNFDGLESWLEADPVHRDDALFLLEGQRMARLHDVVRGAGRSIQLTVWPEDFVIEPDPPPAEARR
jgi:endonuclease YncB( thermonuclease family)